MKLLLTGLILLFSGIAQADVYNITSDYADETQYIQVTDTDDALAFKFCDSLTNECEVIGDQEYYLKSKLLSKKRREYLKVAGATVGDAGIGIAAFFGGAWAGMTYLASNMTFAGALMTSALSGAGATTVSQFIATSVEALNPAHHFSSGRLIAKTLNDSDQEVSDILNFRNNLEELLLEI